MGFYEAALLHQLKIEHRLLLAGEPSRFPVVLAEAIAALESLEKAS